MDRHKCTTLMEMLQSVPDTRKARGKRYEWPFLLWMIALAVTQGQRSVHAIADWIRLHKKSMSKYLGVEELRLPSESTIWRALRSIDVNELEKRVAQWGQRLNQETERKFAKQTHCGLALDGKELRGVRAHGKPTSLVSVVSHSTGIVLAQAAVEKGGNEISAWPRVLGQCHLAGKVVTVDAMFTQQELARYIRRRKGHYLMVVKGNQRHLQEAIALLFNSPPWTRQEQDQEYWAYQSVEKGHGRIETRVTECSSALRDYLRWPGNQQVVRRTCRRVRVTTGEISQEVSYAITSLSHQEAGPAEVASLWRGHWTIENRLHYVRDVTLGEDACQVHTGHTPQVLAALRNAVLALFRAYHWNNIADAIRYYSASLSRTLRLIGIPSS